VLVRRRKWRQPRLRLEALSTGGRGGEQRCRSTIASLRVEPDVWAGWPRHHAVMSATQQAGPRGACSAPWALSKASLFLARESSARLASTARKMRVPATWRSSRLSFPNFDIPDAGTGFSQGTRPSTNDQQRSQQNRGGAEPSQFFRGQPFTLTPTGARPAAANPWRPGSGKPATASHRLCLSVSGTAQPAAGLALKQD
jgi:hypothetical protein